MRYFFWNVRFIFIVTWYAWFRQNAFKFALLSEDLTVETIFNGNLLCSSWVIALDLGFSNIDVNNEVAMYIASIKIIKINNRAAFFNEYILWQYRTEGAKHFRDFFSSSEFIFYIVNKRILGIKKSFCHWLYLIWR